MSDQHFDSKKAHEPVLHKMERRVPDETLDRDTKTPISRRVGELQTGPRDPRDTDLVQRIKREVEG